MTSKEIAIYKLLSSNYQIYITLDSEIPDIVIKLDNKLCLCLIRSTRDTGRGPNVIFTSLLNNSYDYLLAIEILSNRCWLIPIDHLDLTKKSMMLCGFANEYSLVPQTKVKKVLTQLRSKEVKKITQEVVKKEVFSAKTNEDVMNLLK
jgi:hypothetical protein